MAANTRLSRLLSLLRLVAAGNRTNAGQLAELLGVSRRTIFRDVDILRQAEVPIFFNEDAGAYGLLHPDPLTSTIFRIHPEEIMLLLAAAHVSPLRYSASVQLAIDNAIATLVAASKDPTRVAAGNLLACCTPHQPDEKAEAIDESNTKATLLEAVKRGRQVRVSLTDRLPEDHWHTKVAPYRILIDHNDWILIGRSSYDRETCQFHVADIRRIELTDDPFTVPANLAQLENRRLRYDSPECLAGTHAM